MALADDLPKDPAKVPAEAAAPREKEDSLRLVPGALPPVVYPKTAWRFGAPDVVLTGAGVGMALASIFVGPNPNGPRGEGTPFDEDVRDALLPSNFETQLLLRD